MSITIENSKTLTCNYCGSTALVKYGNYKDTQLYWCKVCNRKIKADDMTFKMKPPF
jgi:transposase-like protein